MPKKFYTDEEKTLSCINVVRENDTNSRDSRIHDGNVNKMATYN